MPGRVPFPGAAGSDTISRMDAEETAFPALDALHDLPKLNPELVAWANEAPAITTEAIVAWGVSRSVLPRRVVPVAWAFAPEQQVSDHWVKSSFGRSGCRVARLNAGFCRLLHRPVWRRSLRSLNAFFPSDMRSLNAGVSEFQFKFPGYDFMLPVVMAVVHRKHGVGIDAQKTT